MGLKETLKKLLVWFAFDQKWKCNICDEEIFNGEYFCDKCKSELPLNNGHICEHCGRQTEIPEKYCLTCKDKLVNVDIARSSFVYDKPVSGLIKDLKYNKKQYLANPLGEYLVKTYKENSFDADYIIFPPMTEKAFKKRKYNQAELLSKVVSEGTGVPIIDVIEKVRETERQATLNREQRLKNLKGAFRVTKRKILKDKTIMIIDDVTTTGATSEIIAEKLKRAGARKVILLTVASTPSKK